MPAPMRLTFSGGPLAELLTLIPQLRRITICKIDEDTMFLFYQGLLLGGATMKNRLARIFDRAQTTAELVSSDKLDDLADGAVSVNTLILEILREKDECSVEEFRQIGDNPFISHAEG